jgi:hypothetical protein
MLEFTNEELKLIVKWSYHNHDDGSVEIFKKVTEYLIRIDPSIDAARKAKLTHG